MSSEPDDKPGKATGAAESLTLIKRQCEVLLRSEAAILVNFAVRTLAEVRTCETQLPSVDPPAHLTEIQ